MNESNQNVKVYETSIIPKGEKIEPLRPTKMLASNTSIEVVHIIITLGVLVFLFASSWKKAVAKEAKR